MSETSWESSNTGKFAAISSKPLMTYTSVHKKLGILSCKSLSNSSYHNTPKCGRKYTKCTVLTTPLSTTDVCKFIRCKRQTKSDIVNQAQNTYYVFHGVDTQSNCPGEQATVTPIMMMYTAKLISLLTHLTAHSCEQNKRTFKQHNYV